MLIEQGWRDLVLLALINREKVKQMFNSKYDAYYTDGPMDNLIAEGEKVLWSDKPKKNAFIINNSMGMLPVALIWLVIDGFFIAAALTAAPQPSALKIFLLVFFAIHLMPVWVWLGKMMSSNKRWKNTEYIVTDRRIIIRGGFIGYKYQNLFYTDIKSVDLNVGIVDRLLKVGDIHIMAEAGSAVIYDVEQPHAVFNLIQKTVLDIQAGIHYPNVLRPEANPGYKTSYDPREG